MKIDVCDCNLDIDSCKINSGRATLMDYEGNGIFYCVVCQKTYDKSSVIYKVRLDIFMRDGSKQLKIIKPYDIRLDGCLIDEPIASCHKDALEEDMQGFMYGWYLECHHLGYFDVEVYWLRYSFKVGENYLWFDQGAVASGEQYELELDIIKEQKLRRF